jgi:hypothetical protein
LSYSGGSGGSGKSFSNRGSASQKKEKKKKQEFHKHRLKFTPEVHQSLDQLKERASIGLQKLGAQVFSSEPGGYGFHNWMTSFNLLLDDFEEKCNPSSLPKEYHDTRLRLTSELLQPADTTLQDSQIQKLEGEVSSLEEKIAEIAQKSEKIVVDEWHEDEAKINRLKKERLQIELDITSARESLEAERKKANRSVMKRLFSGSEALKPFQAKLDSLIQKRGEIERNLQSLEEDRIKKQGEVKKFDTDILRLRADLEELKVRSGEVEAQKLEVLQLTEKRASVSKSMADLISSLHLSDSSSGDNTNPDLGEAKLREEEK